jgi:4'-phosphopantetheinyl transferase
MNLPLELIRGGEPVVASFTAAFQQELESVSASVSSFLGPAERAYLETLQFPVRRDSYLLGRYAAKQALRDCLKHSDLTDIEVVKGVFEQPVVLSPFKASAELSLAHTRGVAVAIACRAGHPMGVDIEFLGDDKAEFLSSYLTAAEEELIHQADKTANNGRYLLWTMKEALSKALRCGLMTPLEVFEVANLSDSTGGSWLAYFTNFAQYKAHSWSIDRYILSIVLPKNTEIVFSPTALLPHLALARAQVERGNVRAGKI